MQIAVNLFIKKLAKSVCWPGKMIGRKIKVSQLRMRISAIIDDDEGSMD
jgi:hypothetical protein